MICVSAETRLQEGLLIPKFASIGKLYMQAIFSVKYQQSVCSIQYVRVNELSVFGLQYVDSIRTSVVSKHVV